MRDLLENKVKHLFPDQFLKSTEVGGTLAGGSIYLIECKGFFLHAVTNLSLIHI